MVCLCVIRMLVLNPLLEINKDSLIGRPLSSRAHEVNLLIGSMMFRATPPQKENGLAASILTPVWHCLSGGSDAESVTGRIDRANTLIDNARAAGSQSECLYLEWSHSVSHWNR
jgi:hypothetical protein